MRILFTNLQLTGYTGTEIVVRDLTLALRKRGHEVLIYTPRPGAVSDGLRAQGVPVTGDLDHLRLEPDVIHGHHSVETLAAMLRFPAVPAIYVCHDATSVYDQPFHFSRIVRYVAVDDRCRGRIERVREIPRPRIRVIHNAVDLERFHPRGPLPARPERALVFSNQASSDTYLPAVQEACRRAGLKLDVVGLEAGTQTATPETALPRYDIVFAKARCALEAMAVGNAVVLCDFSGSGPMVTAENFDRLRALNFGQGVLLHPIDPGILTKEIQRYDPADADAVTRRVRAEAGLEAAAQQWTALYQETIEEWRAMKTDAPAEQAMAAGLLRKWSLDRRSQQRREQMSRLVRNIPLAGKFLHHRARKIRRWLDRRNQL